MITPWLAAQCSPVISTWIMTIGSARAPNGSSENRRQFYLLANQAHALELDQ